MSNFKVSSRKLPEIARATVIGGLSVSMLALVAGMADAQTAPLAVTAAAASNAAASNNQVEEVVVTARKRKENIIDTPLSISAYGAKALSNEGIVSLHALDEVVPSVTITNFGAGNIADASINIRGIGTADHLILTDPGVGVYLDGVYLGRSMGNNMTLANIDQVEVLRGPQGTLSGRNTLGGAVNIVTKEPYQGDYAEISATGGTRGRANASFYGNTAVTDTLAMSLTGSFEHRDGIGDFINLPGEATKVGQSQTVSGRAAAKWTPNDRVSVLVAVDGSRGDYGLTPMKVVILNDTGYFTTPSTTQPYLSQASLPKNENDNGTANYQLPNTSSQSFGGSVTTKVKIDDHLSVKLIGSERYSAYAGGLDDTDSAAQFSEFPERGWARQYTGELQLNGEYDRFDFVTGAYGFTEKGNANQPDEVYGLVPGKFDVGQTTDSWALYGHGGYKVTDRLKLSAGIRYTSDHKDATAYILDDIDPQIERSDSWDAITWDVAADYKVQPNLNAYATIQRGYESGGYPARPFGGAATFVPYNPTYATNYEVGLKGQLFNILRFSSALFYTQYQDLALQFSQPVQSGYLTITANAGQSRTYGAEFEGTLLLGRHFSLNSDFGYNDARVTQVAAGVQGVATGDIPQLTPKYTTSIGPQYRYDLASGDQITARIDWSYRSDMYGQSANDPANLMKSRNLTNFNVSYTIPQKQLTFSIYGNNIFDKVYDEARIDSASAGFTEIIRSNDRSEFGVKIKKAFGG